MNLQTTSTAALSSGTQLSRDVARALQKELEAGERIRWTAQPIPGRAPVASVSAVVFAIPWTAFAVFWTISAAQSSLLFALWGIPFIGVGISMLASPFVAYRNARHTVFVVTDRRVVTIEAKMRATSVRSFAPEYIKHLERRERPDGSGDLVLAKRMENDSDGNPREIEETLVALPNVREAEHCVRALIAASTPT